MPHHHNCTYEYKLITPPASAPITVDAVKENLRIDASDTSQDAFIDRLIDAATGIAEQFLNRQLVTQSWVLFLADFHHHHHHHHHSNHHGIELRKRPFASLTKVEYYPTTWNKTDARTNFDTNQFFIPEATQGRDVRIVLFEDESFPDTFNVSQAVSVEFVAGQAVADISEDIKQALHLITAFLFENPGDCCDDCSCSIPAKTLLQQHRIFASC
jgi:uncharacterized phiE125 gp8 family phage protein